MSNTKDAPTGEETIVNLETSWSLPKIGNGNEPVILTLVGAPFRTPKGVERSLRYSIAVPDGNYEKALDSIRSVGGAYFPKADRSGGHWFLPWPPAAIRIAPARKAPRPAG